AMATFFEKISRRYGFAGREVPAILQTHPVTSARIAEARDRARRLPQNRPENSISYELAKARVEVLAASDPRTALRVIEAKPDQESAPVRYGRGLALTALGRQDEAERIFAELVSEYPGVIAYRIGLGEALAESGADEQALEVYADAV